VPIVYRGCAERPDVAPGTVLTIGNFDGVHLGHQALISQARAIAGGRPVCVLTFDPPPRDVLRPDNGIPRVQTLADKIRTLGAAGADEVVVEPFTHATAELEAEAFATRFIARHLRPGAIVVGFDFRFGRRRSGTSDTLRRALGVEVFESEAVRDHQGAISSSRVREAVRAGRVREATRLLGRPHALSGVVVHGDGRGRQLGFPTANVAFETHLTPPPGVYAVDWCVDGAAPIRAVANLGLRPTFNGEDLRLEVHIPGLAGDLYGVHAEVRLLEQLREERRFASLDALIAAIQADVAAALAWSDP
jgi:riboflavin kinase/FMN adenylyltransferase